MRAVTTPARPRPVVLSNACLIGRPPGPVVVGSDGTLLAAEPVECDHVDLEGRLLVPRLAEPHVHLDRAFSLALTGPNRSGTLVEAITRFRSAMAAMTVDELARGARRALALLAAAGVGHLRTHTACGQALGFRAWEAVERAASEVPGLTVEQVAMPLDDPDGDPGRSLAAREAAARGAVALGGAPWLAADPRAATRSAAALAAELGIGLDLHVDETDDPSVNTILDLAEAVEETGLSGRAVAVHCCSMAGRPVDVARAEAEALARAGVAVVVCPVSSLSLQGRSSGARGIAPVGLLRDAGVEVGIGLDNIRDVVVGVGTADPLRAGWLLALGGHMTGEPDLEWIATTVLAGNRRILSLPPWPSIGDPADLLVVDARSPAEAVALVSERRLV